MSRTALALVFACGLSGSTLLAQPSLHPGGPSAAPRHPPTNPATMTPEEREKRDRATEWLILRLGGGILLGSALLGGAVLLGQRRRRRREQAR